MKATFYNVVVVRDAHFHIPRQVSGWELPILQEIYGEGQIEIGEEVVRDIPDVDMTSERARLERLYRIEEETKTPYVDVVYGRGPAGAKALAQAIKQYTSHAAVEEEEEEAPPAPRRGRPPKAVEA